MTTSGALAWYPISPTSTKYLNGITSGPDGALWFTETATIGRITTSGALTEFPLPSSLPLKITSGPDGALWFTDGGLMGRIGRITTAGASTWYPVPTPDPALFGICTGPDGALWFTEQYAEKLGRITTSGAITEFPMPLYTNGTAITTGSDGSLWTTVPHPVSKVGQVVFQNATLTIAPDTGVPGSRVTLTGTGFGPNEAVNLYANSTSQFLLGSITSDPTGSFSFDAAARETYRGANSVVGIGGTSGHIGVGQFVVKPYIVLIPNIARPGDVVRVEGYGFGPEQSISLYWPGAPSRIIGTAITDSNSSFKDPNAIEFQVPALATPGSYGLFTRGSWGSFSLATKRYLTIE